MSSTLRANTTPSWVAGLPVFVFAVLLLGSSGSWSQALRATSSPPTTGLVLVSGTPVTIELRTALSTRASRPGDVFVARVSSPVMAEERVAVPAGAKIVGHVANVHAASRLDPPRIELVYDSMEFGGRSYPVRIRRTLDETLGLEHDPAWIGGGSVVGGVISSPSRGDRRGGASNPGTFALFKSKDRPHLALGVGTRLVVKLDHAVVVRQSRAS